MDDHRDAWYSYVELTHRYAAAVDRGAGSEVAGLFVPDGRWDGTDYGLAVLTGSEALTRHFDGSDEQSVSVHLVHNHLVLDVSPSRMTARSCAQTVLRRDGGTRQLIVSYDDVLALDRGAWRFVERVLGRLLSF